MDSRSIAVMVATIAVMTQSPAAQGQAKPAGRWSHQDWPTGHYRVVEGWPKPLPDTRHSHNGWTWGSFGGVYAENPDRIWVAMRGELPLPKGAAPWTPYAAVGAPVPALDHRVRSPGQPRRRVAASRRAVLQKPVRPRAPPDQDQPL